MDKTVCVKNLGCKVNAYECEYIMSLFLNDGYKIVNENANVYVINTCTVTNEADKKSRKTINSIRKHNKDSIIIALGCYTQNLYNTNKNIDIDADIILGNKDKNKIIEYLNEYLNNKEKIIKFYDVSSTKFEDMEISHLESHTRAFIKIQDGCDNYCSYCVIPYVRGNVKSKNKNKILEEVNNLVNNGYKEIVLTGIHTGKYNDSGYNLYNLLLDLIEIDKLKRIRISSIEIVEISDKIISLLSNEKIANHMHLPLQSGCNKILKLMNRRYDKEYYENKINQIRSVNPNISITTDVIVGFPGETEDDFNETYEFCKKIGFSKIHVFPYSDRDGTESSKMDNKVNEIVKKERVKKLIELSNKLENTYKNKFNNKYLDVLFEKRKFLTCTGYSSNYIEVKKIGFYKLNNIYKVKYKC